jgi:hypothetical protein
VRRNRNLPAERQASPLTRLDSRRRFAPTGTRSFYGPADMPIILRWLFAFILLSATFNSSEWNFVRWARTNYAEQLPLTVFLGLLLTIGYIIYLRATIRSIGAFGMILVLAVVGALIWVLHDYGFLTLDNTTLNVWLAIFALSVVLGIGLSWSIVRRRLSGQQDMDDVDER